MNRLRKRYKGTLSLVATSSVVGLSIVLAPVSAQGSTTTFTGPAPSTSTCRPQYPAAPAHQANKRSPSGFAEQPSSAIGQIGKMAPLPDAPSWNGEDAVYTLAEVGHTVFLGGVFNSYVWKGKTYTGFHNLMAINALTGAPDLSFKPNVGGGVVTPGKDFKPGNDPGTVLTITPSCSGKLLFIGGNFTKVNGVTRNFAAKVNVSDGSLAPWNPDPNYIVEDMSIMRGHLVMTGQFTQVNGVPRTYMASLGSQTAASPKPDSWLDINVSGSDPAGPAKVLKLVANHKGTFAVMIGNFNDVGGKNHRRIAVLELTNTKAVLMPWFTPITASNGNSNTGTDCSKGFPDPERDVTWAPNDARFVTASTGGAHKNTICDSVAKWNGQPKALLNTDAMPMEVNYTGGDTQSAVVCTDVSCISTGHNRWANNPPIRPLRKVTPCDNTVEPYKLGTGNAGYNCQDPGQSLVRPGIFETRIETSHEVKTPLQSIPEMPATAWNPGRSRQKSMHNAEMITPQGFWLGTDSDRFYCPNFKGSTNVCQPHNDIVLVPFNTPVS